MTRFADLTPEQQQLVLGGKPRRARTRTTRREISDGQAATWRCHGCGHIETGKTPVRIERHCHELGHHRYELVIDTGGRL